jgi:hypothetical protein
MIEENEKLQQRESSTKVVSSTKPIKEDSDDVIFKDL